MLNMIFHKLNHQQHLHRQQVDEDHPLVPLAGAMAVVEGERQELLGCRNRRTAAETSRPPSGSRSSFSSYPVWSRCRTWLYGPRSICRWPSAPGCSRSSGWSCRWLGSEVCTGAAYWSETRHQAWLAVLTHQHSGTIRELRPWSRSWRAGCSETSSPTSSSLRSRLGCEQQKHTNCECVFRRFLPACVHGTDLSLAQILKQLISCSAAFSSISLGCPLLFFCSCCSAWTQTHLSPSPPTTWSNIYEQLLTLLANILRSSVTANITGRALKPRVKPRSLTACSQEQLDCNVWTHQFSSLCAWNALRNDVAGQGQPQRLSQTVKCVFIRKDIERRASGTCRLQQSRGWTRRRYTCNEVGRLERLKQQN